MSAPVEKYHHPTPVRKDWETPPALFAKWDSLYHFTLDACATPENAKCARYFTPNDDGLEQDWGREVVWCNPPYGREIGAWMRKAWASWIEGATVVLLVPARTDSRWWHDYAAKGRVTFLRGRVRFVGAPYNAPLPVPRIRRKPRTSSHSRNCLASGVPPSPGVPSPCASTRSKNSRTWDR